MVKKGCLTRFWNESEKEAPQDETTKLTNQRKIDGKGLAIVADAHGLLRQQHESVAEVVEPCAVGGVSFGQIGLLTTSSSCSLR